MIIYMQLLDVMKERIGENRERKEKCKASGHLSHVHHFDFLIMMCFNEFLEDEIKNVHQNSNDYANYSTF